MTSNLALRTYVTLATLRMTVAHRFAHDDRGEGVISAAIAVLVMAFLGALMWVGFKAIFQDTQNNIHNQVRTVGN